MSKLSELVAVRVMGAKVIGTLDPVPDGFYVRNGAVCYGNDGPNRCWWFRPDEEIADAWRVVEKMREKGWRFVLEDVGNSIQRCEFWKEEDDDTQAWFEFQECGKEPLAICIAALRACGVSEGEIDPSPPHREDDDDR